MSDAPSSVAAAVKRWRREERKEKSHASSVVAAVSAALPGAYRRDAGYSMSAALRAVLIFL